MRSCVSTTSAMGATVPNGRPKLTAGAETDVQHVTILDEVVLAFQPLQPAPCGLGARAALYEVAPS